MQTRNQNQQHNVSIRNHDSLDAHYFNKKKIIIFQSHSKGELKVHRRQAYAHDVNK